MDEASRAGLDTGPMGEKIEDLLRDEDGRRLLQPILTVAAERGVLFIEDIDAESLLSEEINDAYRINYEYAPAVLPSFELRCLSTDLLRAKSLIVFV